MSCTFKEREREIYRLVQPKSIYYWQVQITTKKLNGLGQGVIEMTLGRVNWSDHSLHFPNTDFIYKFGGNWLE